MWARSSCLCTPIGPRHTPDHVRTTRIWVFRHACLARIKPISVWTVTQPFLPDRWLSVELELVTSCFHRSVKMVRGTKLWSVSFYFLRRSPIHHACFTFGGYSILFWSDCDAAYVLNSIFVCFPVTVHYRRRYCKLLAFMSFLKLINKKMMKMIARVADMFKGGNHAKALRQCCNYLLIIKSE